MTLLPIARAHELETRTEERRWLVTGLWAEQGVGIIGGEPKCCKSLLALDIVVSVAAGTPCLRRFPVTQPGRVLLYAAEDALDVVRRRLEGICAAAGVELEDLDIQVITAPSVRLDLEADRRNLEDTVATLKPRLLMLDPFVRLHRIDENISGEVAPVLAYLRDLQRRHDLAVAVVHHAKKGGGRVRAGQALRGSSEFHAWGDSNLYLRRDGDELTLTTEHRAAAQVPSLTLELASAGDALALQITQRSEPREPQPATADDRIIEVMRDAGAPIATTELRAACQIRNATLYERLAALAQRGVIIKTGSRYRLATP